MKKLPSHPKLTKAAPRPHSVRNLRGLRADSSLTLTLERLILGFLQQNGGKYLEAQLLVSLGFVLNQTAKEILPDVIASMARDGKVVNSKRYLIIPQNVRAASLPTIVLQFREARKKAKSKPQTTDHAVLRRLCLKFGPDVIAKFIPRFFINIPPEKQTNEAFENYVKKNFACKK